MIISRAEFEKLMEAAEIGTAQMSNDYFDQIENEKLVERIKSHIDNVDDINGKKAERISIDVVAN